MNDRDLSYRISLSNERALAALREFAATIKRTDQAGAKLTGTQGGLKAVGAEARATAGELGKVDAAARGVGASLGSLRSIGGVAVALGAIVAGLQAAKAAFVGLPQAGIQFSRSMETAELGMAGVLSSMTTIDGRAVSLNQALGISRKIIGELNNDALATAASSEELVRVFQAILGPGLAAKMTLQQIRELTVVGTSAVKSMGMQTDQIVQELRDLVQGGIQPSSSQLASVFGITDADIARAKKSSEGLFAFLMERLRGIEAASARFGETFDGRLSALKEGATRAAAEGFEPLFSALKEGLGEATDAFVTIEREGDKVSRIQLNPTAVQGMRSFAQTLVGLGQTLATGARFLVEHRDAVLALAQAYLAFKAFQVVRAILEGMAGALRSTTAAIAGGDAATRASTAATLADLRAKVAHTDAIRIHTAMLLADARAQVAAASGMQRLALAQNLLVPAQQRAAAAAAAHSAALGTLNTALGATGAAGVLSRVVDFLGGPIGLVALLLTGVTAWASFGRSAKESLNGIDVSAKNASDRIKQLKQDLKFGSGEAGDNKAAREALQQRIGALEGATPTRDPDLFNVSPTERITRVARDRELKSRREQLAQQEELGRLMEESARRQADEVAAGLPQGGQLQNKFSPAIQAFNDLVKTYRSTAQKAGDDIKEINDAFAKAVAETPELQKSNAKFDPKRLAEVERARNAAIAEARKKGGSGKSSLAAENAVERAELAQLKTTLDQELALKKDALDFARTENERAYRDGLTSIASYHDERLRLVTVGLDAEKARNDAHLDALKAEQARLDSLKPKTDNERLQIKAASTRIETEVISLNARNLKLEQDRTQAIRDANAERERAARLLQAQAIDVEVDVARSAGTLTRDQIEQQVRTRNRDLVEQSRANPTILSPDVVEKKIQIEIDEAELAQIQQKINGVLDTFETQGRALELAGFEGPALEMALRPAREAAQTQLYGLIPQLEALSGKTVSIEVKAQIEEAIAQIKGLGPAITNLDVVAKNAAVNGFGQLFTDIVNGTKKAGAAFDNFMRNIADQMLNAIGQKLGEKLINSLFDSSIGKFFGLSAGGPVQKRAGGGLITGPGTGTSDSIPAVVPAGSFVVKAAAVRKLGVDYLDSLAGEGVVDGAPMPVMVSNREYLFGPQAVKRLGMRALAALNNGRAAFAGGGLVGLAQLRPSVSPAAFAHRSPVARFAGGGLVNAPLAKSGNASQPAAPTVLDLRIAPEALHMTLSGWLEGELSRMAATR